MQKIYRIWWVSLFIKLVLAAAIPFSFDEAYYWVWSRHLQLSYFDHPPMIAYLLSLGGDSARRWPVVILGHLTLLLWIVILKNIIDIEKIRWWLYLALLSPLMGFGSLVATPDVPLVFFWSLSLFFFLQILQHQRLRDYLALGLSLGLGFCSKYHIVLFPFSVLIFLIVEKKWREVRPQGVLITLIFFFLTALPVIFWNYQNSWASFNFQMQHGLGRSHWNPQWTLSYLGGQIAIIFPSILWWALRARVRAQYPFRILSYFAWVPLAFFVFSSFRGPVEANWPIVAYLPLFALAVTSISKFKSLYLTLGFWALCGLVVSSSLIFPWWTSGPEKLREAHDLQPFLSELKNFAPLYASKYQIASWLWLSSGVPHLKLYGMGRHDFFDELQPSPPREKIFYLLREDGDGEPLWLSQERHQVTLLKSFRPRYELVEIRRQ